MAIGIVFVGWGGIRASKGTEVEINIPALILIFGAQTLNGMTLIAEEIIFTKYTISPMLLLGLEGAASMILQICLLIVL